MFGGNTRNKLNALSREVASLKATVIGLKVLVNNVRNHQANYRIAKSIKNGKTNGRNLVNFGPMTARAVTRRHG